MNVLIDTTIAFQAFLREWIIFDIQQEVKSHVIALRRRYKFRLPGAIVAATSVFLQVPLLTADSDFK